MKQKQLFAGKWIILWVRHLELFLLIIVGIEAKIKKLAAGVHEAKVEVGRVQFELNMKITELQLKLHPTTPPEVWEQHKDAVKESMATLDATVTDYVALF